MLGSLEEILRDLPRHGQLVKDRGYRQIWRIQASGKAYFLKFYPRHGVRDWFRRRMRGSPGLREFDRLQRLQRADIAAPRAVAFLAGLRVENRVGDGVILQAIEPSITLDTYLNGLELRNERAPDHLAIAAQVVQIVHQLAKAGLGHEDLHLGNFLLQTETRKVFLLDGYAVRAGALKRSDLLLLGQSASRFGTRTDLLRGWRQLAIEDAALPPVQNSVSNRIYRVSLARSTGDSRYFGQLRSMGWTGLFFKQARFERPWSQVSQLTIERADWEDAWPKLLEKVERDEFEVIKRTASGDVLGGEIQIAGKTIAIIIKHPKKKFWYRYINEIGRGARARRAWFKSQHLIARNIPTAWPLLLMEKRVLGYATQSLIVFERLSGPTLAKVDLDAIPQPRRENLFRRAGRILRRIEMFGFSHFDAKSSNWIVLPHLPHGETPVLVDPDGIRARNRVGIGIERLLRSMKNHPQYTPADSLALCRGYAPYSRIDCESPQETVEES